MRPPRVRDILAVDAISGDAAKEVRLLANLCDVSPRAVEDLDLRDYEALQREYSRFQTISAADARRAVLALAARTGWALGEVQEFDVAELTKWLEGLAELTATATAGAPGPRRRAVRSAADVVAQVATITDGVPGQVGAVVATACKNLGRGLAGDQAQQISQVGAILTRTQQRYQIENFGQLGQALAASAGKAHHSSNRLTSVTESAAVASAVSSARNARRLVTSARTAGRE